MLLIAPMKTVHAPWNAVVKQQQQKMASVAEGVEHPGPSCLLVGRDRGAAIMGNHSVSPPQFQQGYHVPQHLTSRCESPREMNTGSNQCSQQHYSH